MPDLQTYLEDHYRIAPDEVIAMLISLCRQLQEENPDGSTHGAIAPDNILIASEGGVIRSILLSPEDCRTNLDPADPWSALELYGGTEQEGSWSDVYSLSAVAYRCITGIDPEPAPQRLLLDELQPFSRLGIQVNENCGKVVMKGLALEAEDRYRSVEDFLEALNGAEQEGRLAEEQRKELHRRRRKRRMIAGGCTAFAFLLAGGLTARYLIAKRQEDLFRGMRTETIAFAPGLEEDTDDFESAVSVIEGRLKFFTEDAPYQLDRRDNGLYLTTAYDVWEGTDPDSFISTFLAAPWNLEVISQCRATPVMRVDFAHMEVLQETEEETDGGTDRYWYVKITLKPEACKEIAAIADQDPEAEFYLDRAAVYVSYDPDTAVMKFGKYPDRRTAELAKYILEQPGWNRTLNYTCELPVKWEGTGGNIFAGKLQADAGSISDPAVVFTYSEPYDEQTDPETDPGAWIRYVSGFKQRLDAFGKEYAIGVCDYSPRSIAVKMRYEDVDSVLMYTLSYADSAAWIGNAWEELCSLGSREVEFLPEENAIRVMLNEDAYSEDLQNYSDIKDRMSARGQNRLYLYLGSYRVMAADVIMPENSGSNELLFSKWIYPPESSDSFSGYGSYLCSYAENFDMTGVRLQGYAQTDRKGRLVMPGTEYGIIGYTNPESTLTEDIKELLPGAAVGIERRNLFYSSDEACLKIYLQDSEYSSSSGFLDAVKMLVQKADVLCGEYPEICIYLMSKDDIRRCMLQFFANKETYGYDLTLCSTGAGWDHEYYEETAKQLQTDPFFETYITPDTFLG